MKRSRYFFKTSALALMVTMAVPFNTGCEPTMIMGIAQMVMPILQGVLAATQSDDPDVQADAIVSAVQGGLGGLEGLAGTMVQQQTQAANEANRDRENADDGERESLSEVGEEEGGGDGAEDGDRLEPTEEETPGGPSS